MQNQHPAIAYLKKKLGSISDTKLTVLLYLADWKAAIDLDRQITPFQWSIGASGFTYTQRESLHDRLAIEDQAVLNHVIGTYKKLDWFKLLQIAYSTHPILNANFDTVLDLVTLARQYNAVKPSLEASAMGIRSDSIASI